MTQVKWRDFRENLADIIERVRSANERIQITRHGKVVAEIGPPMRTSFYKQTSKELASNELTAG
jgi:antitoxin (DNA-binding transcriptional repressor) of toxin-antitoxin stability system